LGKNSFCESSGQRTGEGDYSDDNSGYKYLVAH